MRQAAARWAATWERAWNSGDVDAIVSLYATACAFSSQPFRAVHRGRAGVREYVSAAFGDEDEVEARFGTPVVEGDRAAVAWWAALREGGQPMTLAGISLLRFDESGLVVDQYDAWDQLAGRHVPPEGWGG